MKRDFLGLRSFVILACAVCGAVVAFVEGGATPAIATGLLIATGLHALIGN